MPGGSVEHWNEEAGRGLARPRDAHLSARVWLNPVAQKHWDYSESTILIRRLFATACFR